MKLGVFDILTDIEKPQKISGGSGLFLLVTPQGSKLWRLTYRFAGKQKTLVFGDYPTISLADARGKKATG